MNIAFTRRRRFGARLRALACSLVDSQHRRPRSASSSADLRRKERDAGPRTSQPRAKSAFRRLVCKQASTFIPWWRSRRLVNA